jgi:two-component system cell cycle response regulator DivK
MMEAPRGALNDPSAARPRILLVDDCQDSREMYAFYLGRLGFEVAEAGSGRDAIEHAAALPPHVVVMDLSLPDMDGAEVIQHIRSDPRLAGSRVLVLSGHAFPEDRVGGLWDEFLVKPCAPDVLVGAIRRLLACGHPHAAA